MTLRNIENIKIPQKNPSDFDWIDYEKPLSEFENPDLENAILVVISDAKLNMRKGSSKKSARVKYLYYGAELLVVSPEIKNGYILVKDVVDGKVGYVDTDYVVFKDPNKNFEVEEDIDYCDQSCCWCQYM